MNGKITIIQNERFSIEMIVYCDVMDCKNNNDGKCENKWPIGTEAISLRETYTGHLICTDCELEDEEREEL